MTTKFHWRSGVTELLVYYSLTVAVAVSSAQERVNPTPPPYTWTSNLTVYLDDRYTWHKSDTNGHTSRTSAEKPVMTVFKVYLLSMSFPLKI